MVSVPFKATSESYGATGNDQLTGTPFVTYSAAESDKCEGRYPKYYATGSSDEMYLDGWIGAKPTTVLMPADATEITTPIIQVSIEM